MDVVPMFAMDAIPMSWLFFLDLLSTLLDASL